MDGESAKTFIGRISFLSQIKQVKLNIPGFATIRRYFTELPDAIRPEIEQRHATQLLVPIGPGRLDKKFHALIFELTGVFSDIAAIIHPRLLPLTARGIVDVEAFAVHSKRAGPIFENNAIA